MIIVMPPAASSRTTFEDLGHQLRVEGARDLVEEQQVRLHRQRPDDRDPLLLTAGQQVGHIVALVREPEPLEQLGRATVRPLRAAGATPCAAPA